MECKPQISKDSFMYMTQGDKLNVLYDMQTIMMEYIQCLEVKMEKRRALDRISIVIGGVIGGIVGALGINSVR